MNERDRSQSFAARLQDAYRRDQTHQQGSPRRGRCLPGDPGRGVVRAARAERRGQDHHRQDVDHAPHPDLGVGFRHGVRRGQTGRPGPQAHRLHLRRRARTVLAPLRHRQPALLRQPVQRGPRRVEAAHPVPVGDGRLEGARRRICRRLFARDEAASARGPHPAA